MAQIYSNTVDSNALQQFGIVIISISYVFFALLGMYRAQSIILLRHINRRSFTNNTKACSYPQCWGRTLLSLNGNGYNVKNKLLKSSSNLHINNVRFISCSYRLYDKADNGGTEPSKETKRSKVVYFFKNIRYLSSVFLNGCKNLFLDVRVALQTRRKLGLFHQHDYSRLTRDEIHHMYQVKFFQFYFIKNKFLAHIKEMCKGLSSDYG